MSLIKHNETNILSAQLHGALLRQAIIVYVWKLGSCVCTSGHTCWKCAVGVAESLMSNFAQAGPAGVLREAGREGSGAKREDEETGTVTHM